MPAIASRFSRWACLLALQGCLLPDGDSRAKLLPDGDSPAKPEYVFRSPGETDTLAAGTMAQAAWSHSGPHHGSVRLSLWRDSVLITDVLGGTSADSGSMPWALPWGLIPGRYRLRLTSLEVPGAYAFSGAFFVKEAAPDAFEDDDGPARANPIGTDGIPQTHSLGAGDMDWIRFAAVPGRRYAIDLRNNHPPHMDLVDSAGLPLREAVRGGQQIGFTPASPGRHYLRVYPDSSLYGYGPYRVSVREYDPAGSPYTIAFSSPSVDSIWTAGSHTLTWTPDTAVFGSQVEFSLYEDTTFVWNPGILSVNAGTAKITLPDYLYSGGRYRVRISAHHPPWRDPLVFAYSPFFAIEARLPDAYEPDDSRETAKPIAADGSVQRRNHAQGDTDWVRFEARAGLNYLASLTYAYGVTYMQLRDSAGSIIVSTTESGAPIAFVPPRDGTYHLRIVPQGSGGDYGLRLASFATTPDGVALGFTFPAPGAILSADSAYTVSWSPDSAFLSDYMVMALYRGDRYVCDLVTSFLNSGSVPLNLPAGLATGSDYRLRLSWKGAPSLYGFSPAFSIVGENSGLP